MRGFGSDVTLAQVRLNRNSERDAIATLKRDMIRTVNDTERAHIRVFDVGAGHQLSNGLVFAENIAREERTADVPFQYGSAKRRGTYRGRPS